MAPGRCAGALSPLEKDFLLKWFEDVEPLKEKRVELMKACLSDLMMLQHKHTALVLTLACMGYLGVIGDAFDEGQGQRESAPGCRS